MSRRKSAGVARGSAAGRAGDRLAALKGGDQPRRAQAQFSWKIYGYAVLVLCALAVLLGMAVWARPLAVLDAVTRSRLLFEGFHGESTMVDGHRIHYLEGGRGKPILLIHGLGGRATDWANLMPQLSKGGYHVYAIDLLGYGDSDKPKDADYSIEQETAIAQGFLNRLQLAHVDLAGWSMGGWVGDAAGVGRSAAHLQAGAVRCRRGDLRTGFHPRRTFCRRPRRRCSGSTTG